MTGMEEKRRLERFGLRIPASIEAVYSHREKESLNLLTSNVCSGGAYFDTSVTLPEGTEVKIDLILPLDRLKSLMEEHKQARIKVTGKVLRSGATGMAVTFDEDYEILPCGGLGEGPEYKN